MTSRAPSSNNSAATESPSSAAWPGVPIPDANHIGSVCRRHACAQRQLVEDPPVVIDGLDHLSDRSHTGEQPASSSASRTRSAVTAARLSASSNSASNVASAVSPARHSTASAPCAGAATSVPAPASR